MDIKSLKGKIKPDKKTMITGGVFLVLGALGAKSEVIDVVLDIIMAIFGG